MVFERMRAAMIAAELVRDNAASFGRAVHGAQSHHAHKARDFGTPGPETLRYLLCILAITRTHLGQGRPDAGRNAGGATILPETLGETLHDQY